jgi:hypothetical protein
MRRATSCRMRLAALPAQQGIDALELVEFEGGHLQRALDARRPPQGVFEPVAKQGIVRQAGQDVVRKTELEIALRDRLHRHIAALNQQTAGALPISLRDRLQDKVDIAQLEAAVRGADLHLACALDMPFSARDDVVAEGRNTLFGHFRQGKVEGQSDQMLAPYQSLVRIVRMGKHQVGTIEKRDETRRVLEPLQRHLTLRTRRHGERARLVPSTSDIAVRGSWELCFDCFHGMRPENSTSI